MNDKIDEISNTQTLTADKMNEVIGTINELSLMIRYLFYKEVDAKHSAEILAEILGSKDV